jgi:hypothetical protein
MRRSTIDVKGYLKKFSEKIDIDEYLENELE